MQASTNSLASFSIIISLDNAIDLLVKRLPTTENKNDYEETCSVVQSVAEVFANNAAIDASQMSPSICEIMALGLSESDAFAAYGEIFNTISLEIDIHIPDFENIRSKTLVTYHAKRNNGFRLVFRERHPARVEPLRIEQNHT